MVRSDVGNTNTKSLTRIVVAACALALFATLSQPVRAQRHPENPSIEANYQLAARFAPYKIRELLHSTSVSPRWIENSEKFWYDYETSDGKSYYIVDPERGSKSLVFDNDRIAAELTRITRDPYDGKHLPITSIRFVDENTLQFDVESTQDEVEADSSDIGDDDMEEDGGEKPARKAKPSKKVFHFEYDIPGRRLRELDDWEEPDNHASWANISPDGQTVVFARHHNLYKMSASEYQKVLDARRGKKGEDADKAEKDLDVEEFALTDDGEEHYSFAGSGRGDSDIERTKKEDDRKRAGVIWSQDSRRFAVTRSDQRGSGDLWVIQSVGNKRPELESYKYDMPGDTTVTQEEILIYDLESDAAVQVDAERFPDQSISLYTARQFYYPDSREPRRSLWLSSDSESLYFYRISRDLKRVDVCRVDATTGEVTVVIEERLNTYIDVSRLELLESGDLIWWSERDGWGHLYRYAADGTLKNRLTEGAWAVRGVSGIDDAAGVVYFQANGRESDEDPYYQHLYRVPVAGGSVTLLNPGNYDHRVSLGPSNRFFVDNYSRVDTTPASRLQSVAGRTVADLETADFSQLVQAGYVFPEPFTVKAADGITDLYGVMYKPFDFDSTRSYPIVEYVYPGPQTEAVSKSFSTNAYETALAQFGMIVVTVGNRGGHPARSKWYHNYGYGNLRDYGLADKKVTVEQLVDRHDYIDINRVGIYGHSGGGFMSTAAMLVYPDFFKVAVSSSGNHTNDIYNRWWSEKHHGVKEVVSDSGEVTFEYDIDKNPDLAANLKGRLLLTTGDTDNNVHPANTYRMVEALI